MKPFEKGIIATITVAGIIALAIPTIAYFVLNGSKSGHQISDETQVQTRQDDKKTKSKSDSTLPMANQETSLPAADFAASAPIANLSAPVATPSFASSRSVASKITDMSTQRTQSAASQQSTSTSTAKVKASPVKPVPSQSQGGAEEQKQAKIVELQTNIAFFVSDLNRLIEDVNKGGSNVKIAKGKLAEFDRNMQELKKLESSIKVADEYLNAINTLRQAIKSKENPGQGLPAVEQSPKSGTVVPPSSSTPSSVSYGPIGAGVGLVNSSGSQCFMSSSLQMLYFDSAFMKMFNSIKVRNESTPVINYLTAVFEKMHKAETSGQAAANIADEADWLRRNVLVEKDTRGMQDAALFYHALVDRVYDESEKPKTTGYLSGKVLLVTPRAKVSAKFEENKPKDFMRNPPNKEPHNHTLNLSLKKKDGSFHKEGIKISELIAAYSDPEIIPDFVIQAGATPMKIQKFTTDLEFGKTITLQLDRFDFSHAGGARKIHNSVTIDPSITLEDNFVPEQRGLTYDLTGVICHIGQGVKAGHYVAYTNVDGTWFMKNDDTISKVTDVERMYNDFKTLAYMLTYTLRK